MEFKHAGLLSINNAIKHDNANNTNDAFKCYAHGIAQLLFYIKHEKNVLMKNDMIGKVIEYITRAGKWVLSANLLFIN